MVLTLAAAAAIADTGRRALATPDRRRRYALQRQAAFVCSFNRLPIWRRDCPQVIHIFCEQLALNALPLTSRGLYLTDVSSISPVKLRCDRGDHFPLRFALALMFLHHSYRPLTNFRREPWGLLPGVFHSSIFSQELEPRASSASPL